MPRRAHGVALSSQQVWAIIGLSVLVLIAAIAAANLQGIYNSQKDFVVGSLLSLVGFCFGKAFSRTQEQRAIEMIRDSPTPLVTETLEQKAVEMIHISPAPRVRQALSAQKDADLHASGVFAELSVLERNVNAALERLSEYYDSQCRQLDFYQHSSLLVVALDDLDKTAANVVGLRDKLGGSNQEQRFAVPDEVRAMLTTVRRRLRESVNRRNQAYEWLRDRLDPDTDKDVWDLFAVMTSDLLKALRSLEVVFGRYMPYPLQEYHRTILGYLRVAAMRAKQFKEAAARTVETPKIFDVMLEDIHSSIELLEGTDLQAPPDAPPQEPQEPSAGVPAPEHASPA